MSAKHGTEELTAILDLLSHNIKRMTLKKEARNHYIDKLGAQAFTEFSLRHPDMIVKADAMVKAWVDMETT